MAGPTLDALPFPTLAWDGYSWSGEVVLGSWAGFQSRLGPCGSADTGGESDGRPRVSVASEDGRPDPPTPEQARAFQFLLDHEQAVADSILRAILSEYPRLREKYRDKRMPAVERADQLRSMIGPSTVHVLWVASGDVAYVGFEFGCTWDREHGLGVMTHRDRVVRVGGADTSFLWWVADEDAQSS